MYEIQISRYQNNNRVAVQVFDNEGCAYATLSTNVVDVPLSPAEFVLSHDLLHSIFKDFLTQMLATGKVKDTGKTCDFGFCKNVPIWKVV